MILTRFSPPLPPCFSTSHLTRPLVVPSLSGMGYDRNDPSTIKRELMPYLTEKGMALHYGVAHEDFVWKIRRCVLSAFGKKISHR